MTTHFPDNDAEMLATIRAEMTEGAEFQIADIEREGMRDAFLIGFFAVAMFCILMTALYMGLRHIMLEI